MNGNAVFTARRALLAMVLAVGLCAAGLAVCTAPAQALGLGDTFKKDGNVYKVVDLDDDGDDMDEVVLVKYGSSNKKPVVNVVKYKGKAYEVEKIGKNAFNNAKGHKITSIKLGDEVESIGAKAFYGCKKLKTIDLAKCDAIELEKEDGKWEVDDLDIGKKAFSGAGVAKVKVKCGSSKAGYQKLYKKVLVKKGLRSDAKMVK